MRKLLVTLIILFNLTNVAHADIDPSEMLVSVSDKMIGVIKQNLQAIKTDDSIAEKLVRENLLPLIDAEAFAQKTLGSSTWDTLDETQKKAFVSGYINRVVGKYAKGLSLYDGQDFVFNKAEISSKNANLARVKSEMKQNGEQPFHISYILSKDSGDWLITNIIVEGTDMRKSYRQQFIPRINEIGIGPFIAELNAPESAK